MKNKILYGITYAAVAVGFLAGSGLDSENLVPYMAVSMGCLAWVALFYFINKEKIESEL